MRGFDLVVGVVGTVLVVLGATLAVRLSQGWKPPRSFWLAWVALMTVCATILLVKAFSTGG